jgi:threonine aldolase
MIVDLRSDTVTRPVPGMLQAMFSAEVGDDVYEEDPTVIRLEKKAAELFGMEAALFCVSGTMTNQVAIKLLTQPGDEVICDRMAHIYNYEGGGIAFNSGASVRLVEGDRGRISAAQVLENINADNVHYPRTALVALENTVNKGGGCYYSLENIKEIKAVCKQHGLYLHLDGARIFNALVATGGSAESYGECFDTISVCLSKGLGAPVGSLLLADKEKIKRARRIRKVLGGGWRQAGYLAAAGIYALDNHIARLEEDHQRASALAAHLKKLPYVAEVLPAETNIVIFRLKDEAESTPFISYMESQGVKVSAFGKQMIRLVTHLEIDDAMTEKVMQSLERFAATLAVSQ